MCFVCEIMIGWEQNRVLKLKSFNKESPLKSKSLLAKYGIYIQRARD